MSDLIGDEVFVKGKPILAGDAREDCGGFVGRARSYVLTPFNKCSISEVVENSATSLVVDHSTKGYSSGFHCSGRRRDPARAFVEETLGVSIRESYRRNTGAAQLQEDGVVADNFEHRRVWETLFVIAE